MRTEGYRPFIDCVLKRFGISPDELEIVDSIADWCRQNQLDEVNPRRAGKCLCRTSDGACHILLASELTDAMFASHNDAMLVRGFEEELDTLQTAEDSLLHLLLHEVACHVLGTGKQEPRDKWAFAHMDEVREGCGHLLNGRG